MKFYKSISFKFSSWYLGILGALLLALGCSVYFSLSGRLYNNLDNTLQERAEQVVRFRNVLGIVAKGTFEEEPGELLSFYYYTGDNELKDLSHKGRRIVVPRQWIDNVLNSGEGDFSFVPTSDGTKLRLYSTLYSSEDQTDDDRPAPRVEPNDWSMNVDRAVLIIGRTTKNIELTLSQLLKTLVLVLPLTLFLMGCCGIFFLRIVLRPVQNISDTARDIEAKDLSRRIMVTTQDELGTLAATINHMIARLEKAFLRQKELTGDASHELRAPLAVIQAEATLALQRKRDASSYQNSMEIIAKESNHMAAIIRQLLFLARADSGDEMTDLTELNLLPFIQEISADIEPLFHEKQQTLTFHQTGPVVVQADCNLLRTVLLNLLRNAMLYTPEKGAISVTLKKENSMARISVSDNGIGIPKDALPYIFNRFYRVDKARARESGGSGLGLAICKHIVELHRGQISVKSQIDNGTTFSVTLPTA